MSKKLTHATRHPAFYLLPARLLENQFLIKALKREKEASVYEYLMTYIFYDDLNTNLSNLHVKKHV